MEWAQTRRRDTRILASVYNNPEVSLQIDRFDGASIVKIDGQTYNVVACYDDHPAVVVKNSVHAVYFPDTGPRVAEWMWYNDAARCFEAYAEDPQLYAELNASYFASLADHTDMLRCCYMPRLSALRDHWCFMRFVGGSDLIVDEMDNASSTNKSVSVVRHVVC